MFFALKGDNFNGNLFAKEALENGARFAIVDDEQVAINRNYILVDDVLSTLQQLATFHRRYLNIPIVALTGSNGKTTTKELIHAVLSKKYETTATQGNLNNHIGVPLTLLSMTKRTEMGVVEMGANHLKEIAFLCDIAEPDYGYITNFGKAHLEGFGGVEGVIKGKSELYDALKENKKLIFVNTSDKKQIEQLGEYKLSFSFGNDDAANCQIQLAETEPFVVARYKNIDIKSNLIGTYNFNNIAAAIAIGHYFEVDNLSIKEAIEGYVPSNNRSQIIEKNGLKIILDAYNANPTSMKAALDYFNEIEGAHKIVILGDMFELGEDAHKEHQYIADYVTGINIDKVFLVGENFNGVLSKSNEIQQFNSFEALRAWLLEQSAVKEGVILIKGSRGMALERVLELI